MCVHFYNKEVKNETFENTLPDRLTTELTLADRLEVLPITQGGENFDINIFIFDGYKVHF